MLIRCLCLYSRSTRPTESPPCCGEAPRSGQLLQPGNDRTERPEGESAEARGGTSRGDPTSRGDQGPGTGQGGDPTARDGGHHARTHGHRREIPVPTTPRTTGGRDATSTLPATDGTGAGPAPPAGRAGTGPATMGTGCRTKSALPTADGSGTRPATLGTRGRA